MRPTTATPVQGAATSAPPAAVSVPSATASAAAAIPRSPAARGTPTALTPVSGATPATGVKRSINPFLANDPNQKGRRLARALVSDMIAYQPGKREEGLRDGTLKQLFREEIKKSYEEYVDQIGKEFAETTSHFQDALNELLANGQKVF
jgi:hypothetical protein